MLEHLRVLRNGALVVTVLGILLWVQDYKNSNLHDEITRPWQLRG